MFGPGRIGIILSHCKNTGESTLFLRSPGKALVYSPKKQCGKAVSRDFFTGWLLFLLHRLHRKFLRTFLKVLHRTEKEHFRTEKKSVGEGIKSRKRIETKKDIRRQDVGEL